MNKSGYAILLGTFILAMGSFPPVNYLWAVPGFICLLLGIHRLIKESKNGDKDESN